MNSIIKSLLFLTIINLSFMNTILGDSNCKGDVEESCNEDEDCKENNCFHGKCFYKHGMADNDNDCLINSDCASLNCGYYDHKCHQGTFLKGDMCDHNRNCRNNYCVEWKCD